MEVNRQAQAFSCWSEFGAQTDRILTPIGAKCCLLGAKATPTGGHKRRATEGGIVSRRKTSGKLAERVRRAASRNVEPSFTGATKRAAKRVKLASPPLDIDLSEPSSATDPESPSTVVGFGESQRHSKERIQTPEHASPTTSADLTAVPLEAQKIIRPNVSTIDRVEIGWPGVPWGIVGTALVTILLCAAIVQWLL